MQQAWRGGHTVKHDAVNSTTNTCNQVWEDVTAESQAFQPERRELPLAEQAGERRETKHHGTSVQSCTVL